MFTFIPEWCSESARNAVQLRRGMAFSFARIPHAGSTEGFADSLMNSGSGSFLVMWEEFATFLSVAGWGNSTVLEFFTEIYDCPDTFKREYRKKPIHLERPTPSVLTMTTLEWFWKHARAEHFYGGFANRFHFLTGPKKDPIPIPQDIDGERIHYIKHQLQERSHALASTKCRRAQWSEDARQIWERFYLKFESRERKGLLDAALTRSHDYIQKLAMLYAYLEGSFPEIHSEQLKAAIAENAYAMRCAKQMIEMQATGNVERRELELRYMTWIQKNPGQRLRLLHQRMCKKQGDSENFNRVIQSLERSDQIKIINKKVYLSE